VKPERARDRDRDAALMRRALLLAEKFRGLTAPNPTVGCVIADARGEVIAEGAHKGPGRKHAEIVALDKLGGKAPGATMYVTLEPCMHQGRTPPCVPRVRASGVARVVIGTEDPIPGHGGGIEALRRSGISVARALVEECNAQNRGFLTWATWTRPAFTLKAAITLDGKIATVAGNSKWITGEDARTDAHWLRRTRDAVLVGVNTVLQDDPWLNVRMVKGRDPVRIVLDSQLRTPPDAHLLPKKRGPRTILCCSQKAPEAREKALVARGAEVWRFKPRANGQVPLYDLARRLGDESFTSVLVEGGAQVHASFLEADLADEIIIYIAPKAVGGPAPGWIGGRGLETIAAAYKFEFDAEPMFVGEDLKLGLVRAKYPW
jgi:diaminohydroxyphosphoribosylaminopyrimidine deaminase/5-amino-6-(5-phosphoribosylamino)uracil reductase